jgi:hypothetical protein
MQWVAEPVPAAEMAAVWAILALVSAAMWVLPLLLP